MSSKRLMNVCTCLSIAAPDHVRYLQNATLFRTVELASAALVRPLR